MVIGALTGTSSQAPALKLVWQACVGLSHVTDTVNLKADMLHRPTQHTCRRGGAGLLVQTLSSPALAAAEGPHKEHIVRALAAVANVPEGRVGIMTSASMT
jgi:hypothetical protein